MSSLNKVYRRGVDIGVAFSSEAKHQLLSTGAADEVAPNHSQIEEILISENTPVPENETVLVAERVQVPEVLDMLVSENPHTPRDNLRVLQRKIDLILGQINRIAFRLAFRAVQPVLLRLRKYFADGFREDIHPEFQRLSATLIQTVQATQATLKQDLLNTHELTLQEFQKVSAGTLEEVRAVQATQATLKQDLLNTHELTLQEFQKVSAGTLEEVRAVQATQATLKQDLLNTHELTLQEFQKVSAGTLEEVRAVQATQATLKQDLLNTHELTLQEFQKVSAGTLEEVRAVQATQATLKQDLLNTHELTLQEFQKVSAGTLEEVRAVQATQATLKQDLLNTHELTLQEFQKVSAGTLEEVRAVQATQATLKQDLLNTHELTLQEFQKVSAGTLEEVRAVQATQATLKQDLLNTHELTLQEFQKVSAGTLEEVRAVQATQATLKQDLLNTHELTLQEFQKVSAGTLEEVRAVQATQASLKQDLVNTHELTLQEFQKVSAGTLQELQVLASILAPRLDRIEQYGYATARRVAVSCGQGEVMVKTEVGYVLCAATDHALLACLIDTGELELGTRLLIQRFLRPGEVFVDVGANLGLHTLAAARAMQGRGKIIAFEPFELTKRLLEKSVWINGFSAITEIHQAAVSNQSGHQQLYLGATSGHHSLYPLNSLGEFPPTPVDVAVVRLDQIIPGGQKVDLIKIDVEGAELEVLESGVSLLLENPDIALIVEFGPFHLKRTGHTTLQWLKSFSELKLNYRAINSYTGALEDWSLEQLEKVDSINLFFARKDSPAWRKLAA